VKVINYYADEVLKVSPVGAGGKGMGRRRIKAAKG
jgi:hypothetical protein